MACAPDLIQHMLNEKEALIRHSLASSASHITEQHLIRQAEQREDEEAALLEEIGGQEGIERLERELEKLKAEEDELRAKPSREREKFRGAGVPVIECQPHSCRYPNFGCSLS